MICNFEKSLIKSSFVRSMGDSDEEEKTHPIHLVSATQGTGMNELRQAIESRCRVATGRQVRRFLIPMDGEHLQ